MTGLVRRLNVINLFKDRTAKIQEFTKYPNEQLSGQFLTDFNLHVNNYEMKINRQTN